MFSPTRDVASLSAPDAYETKMRVYLLGGCQVVSLGAELGERFDCAHTWYRPTIALMSKPISPEPSLPPDNHHSRYVSRDCTKRHLRDLQKVESDGLVFEILQDVRSPLVGRAGSYIFDPNGMYQRIEDAPAPTDPGMDVAALLGGSDLDFREALVDPGFFELWTEHFAKLYDVVLAPRIAQGCSVIMMKTFLAKRTEPPSDAFRSLWDYCDGLNALLSRMYAHVAGYRGVQLIGLDESCYFSDAGAPYGGPAITHPAREVFVQMAGQARAILTGPGK